MEKLKVFISSTFLDLHDERNALSNLFRDLGIEVLALDEMPSSGQSAQTTISDGITKSDLVILIFGSRYGALLNETKFYAPDRDTCSVTKWEYLHAKKRQKPVLIFIKNTAYDTEERTKNPIKEKLFDQFKSQISHLNNQYFNSVSELKNKVIKSIIAHLHNSKSSNLNELKSENATLKNENINLKGKLNSQLGLHSPFITRSSPSLADYKPAESEEPLKGFQGFGGLNMNIMKK